MWSFPTNRRYIFHIETETNGRHLADDFSKCILLNENVWIAIKISLKIVPKGPFNNIKSDNDLVPIRRQAITWTNVD